ncbi:hypothetical protein L248_1561 [Schleiferilactobacillus shenzhenensis LY-73]|uniref:Gram-positive cocci surface proteins LPxTG domain-containing protein n=2 Tax=Schleiferilactobacillus shenzhenensis TaxID=1231337 RepID=U4TIU2_9LACO|nr:hypothetical protein L248_1561 [Schleiferilactobacillus shenzhenensis LY-73]
MVKKRYKLYKSGKRWLVAGIAFLGVGAALTDAPTVVRAASAPVAAEVTTEQKNAKSAPSAQAGQKAAAVKKTATAQTTANAQKPAPADNAKANAVPAEPAKQDTANQQNAVQAATSVQKPVAAVPTKNESPEKTSTSDQTQDAAAQKTAKQGADAQIADTQTANSVTPSKSTEDKPADAKTPSAKGQDTNSANTKTTDTKAADSAAKDTKASGAKVSDAKGPNAQSTDAKAANTKTPANQAVDDKTTDTQAANSQTDTQAPAKSTDAHQEAADATNKADADAANANATAKALADMLKKPNPSDASWLAKLNTLAKQLNDQAGDFAGTEAQTDAAVKAYQDALKKMNYQPQPNAVKDVTLGDKTETASLAAYDALVASYADQIKQEMTTLKTGTDSYAVSTGLQASQKQLQTAADTLNAKLAAVQAAADQGDTAATDAAVQAMADAKTAYDQARDAYNSDAIVFNAVKPEASKTVPKVDTNADNAAQPDPNKNPADTTYQDFLTNADTVAAQNDAYNQYQAAKTDYQQIKTDNDALADAVTNWQTAAGTYNDTVTDVNKGTASDETAAGLKTLTDHVTTAEAEVRKALADFGPANTTYQAALANYQNALTAYHQKAGQNADPAVPQEAVTGYTAPQQTSAWHQYETSVSQLTSDFDQGSATQSNLVGKNDQTMAQNLKQFTAIKSMASSLQQLQAKITQINTLATAQANAVKGWNDEIAKAKADGRWAFFYQELNKDGDALTNADYAYIDAVNGTTTPLNSYTSAPDQFGKKYTTVKAGAAVTNSADAIKKDAAKASYQALWQTFQDAVDKYNDTATAANRIDTSAFTQPGTIDNSVSDLLKSISGTNGFSQQYQNLLKVLSGLAADPDQNAAALNNLHTPGKDSTDGSELDPADTNFNIREGQNATTCIQLGNGASWATIINQGEDPEQYYGATHMYSVMDLYKDGNQNGDKDHHLSAADIKALFETDMYNSFDPSTSAPSNVTMAVRPEYTTGGKTYYLAGYGVFNETNDGAALTATNQLYTFTTDNPEQEFVENGLSLPGDTTVNSTIVFYYLPTGIDQTVIPAPDPVAAAPAKPITLPNVQLGTVNTDKLANLLGLNATTHKTDTAPVYQSGEAVTPTFNVDAGSVAQAPEIQLNDPRQAPVNPGGGSDDNNNGGGENHDGGNHDNHGGDDNGGNDHDGGNHDNHGGDDNGGNDHNGGNDDNGGGNAHDGSHASDHNADENGSRGGTLSGDGTQTAAQNIMSMLPYGTPVGAAQRADRQPGGNYRNYRTAHIQQLAALRELNGRTGRRGTLPQTGERHNASLSALGAALLSASSLFGLALKRSKHA